MHGRAHNDQFITRTLEALPSGDIKGRFLGLYVARVTNIDDPLKQGRIKARFHWLQEEGAPEMESDWIARVSPFAGPTNLGRGRKFGINFPLPEVGSLVVLGFNGGDPHDGFFLGQPEYQEGNVGAPPSDKDSRNDWSMRVAFQNGFEAGVDTEGNAYVFVPGNLRVKVLCSAFFSARGVMTFVSTKLRHVALSVLRLLGVTIDETNYPRPDEAAELREMNIDAMSASPGRRDPGVGKIPDLH
jgi:type VI secretion system (T6SS) baseplate-like injector VgrG